jgi:hypothetical protein
MKCGKLQAWQNQTQAKQFVAAKVWLGKLWLGTNQAHTLPPSHVTLRAACHFYTPLVGLGRTAS